MREGGGARKKGGRKKRQRVREKSVEFSSTEVFSTEKKVAKCCGKQWTANGPWIKVEASGNLKEKS